jgi:DNA polymerase-1
VPAHSEWGKQTRSIFIPEEGMYLGAFDYKQIEYRLFTHFAQGEPGRAAQQLYHDNPALDYHEMGQRMMGWWYPDDEWANKEARHMMKRLSFGNLYGLKAKTFSEHFKWDLLKSHPNVKQSDLYQLAFDLQKQYQEKVPFIKITNEAIMKVGQKRGYVKTLSGKRQRMPPNPSKGGDDAYKLINYLVQGSAGDVFKKGVCVDAYNAGVFDVLIPHLMVHDEMVFSIPKTKEGYEACVTLKECMANAYPLKVPLGVDTEIGPDWGHCKGDVWDDFEKQFGSLDK